MGGDIDILHRKNDSAIPLITNIKCYKKKSSGASTYAGSGGANSNIHKHDT